jgi:hypothetical protein
VQFCLKFHQQAARRASGREAGIASRQTPAGIQPDEKQPGFGHVVIKPFIPDSLSFVRASAQTVRGRVAVDWKKKNGSLQLNVTIPANSAATVYVPAASVKQVQTTPPLKPVRLEPGAVVYEIGS